MNRLFIIGNGFDIAHKLPTKFDPDFKEIAERIEQNSYFWETYQTRQANIWSDFENCFANPDFNSLEEIFEGYAPDYSSDYERDRDRIITQVDLNGKLMEALYEFSDQAERKVQYSQALDEYIDYFKPSDLFINFNYTHTLEKVYKIDKKQVLHIHGEVGANNLILGYPAGKYEPEKYFYDVRQKGRGPYREVDIQSHIEDMFKNDIIDYYTYTAYDMMIKKIKSFNKTPQIEKLQNFLDKKYFYEIVVIGHSCAIDFPYFEYLNNKNSFTRWEFNPFDDKTRSNIERLIECIDIKNYYIKQRV